MQSRSYKCADAVVAAAFFAFGGVAHAQGTDVQPAAQTPEPSVTIRMMS
jgi:hypothetical protein